MGFGGGAHDPVIPPERRTRGAMVDVTQFESDFASALPQTCELLRRGHLVVDPRVKRIILHGSRGLRGGCRPDSDVDLTLVVDDSGVEEGYEHEALMKAVLEETLQNWKGDVKLDVEAVFDLHGCRMPCLANPKVNTRKCPYKGIDCIGVYRMHGDRAGYVVRAGHQVDKMRPCILIWERKKSSVPA